MYRRDVRERSRAQAAVIKLPPKTLDRRKTKVLLAENNLINQRVVVAILNKQGHDVEIATDGYEALAAMDRHTFDLILMDVQMPRLDGLETATRIRQTEALSGRHTPIVALTAHAMKEDLERCFEAGMDDYLTKPVDVTNLREAVQRWTEPSNLELRT